MNKISLQALKIINNPKGNIIRCLRNDDELFKGFGEAYFSKIRHDSIKAWKKHESMTLNLCVVYGKVKFVFYDDRDNSNNGFKEYVLSDNDYTRLYVPPKIWFGFMGVSNDDSLILNIADMIHDDKEVSRKEINFFSYEWSAG